MDAVATTDERGLGVRRNRVVLASRRWCQVCDDANASRRWRGTKARSPGRSRISR